MYIKEVKIEGFKSYPKSTTVGPFEKNLNVIVNNDSGQGNIFQVLELVFTEDYKKLQNECYSLCFSGSSTKQNASASVEVIFCHTDPKSNEISELTITRIFKTNSAKYYLNGKPLHYNEFRIFLENASFCFKNPYNLVGLKQITLIAALTDSELYNQIESIAGIGIYNEELERAHMDLQAAQQAMEQLNKENKDLGKRLDLLFAENETSKNFYMITKRLTAIHFVLLTRNIESYETELAGLQRNYESNQIMHNHILSEISKADGVIHQSDAKLRELDANMSAEEAQVVEIERKIKNYIEKQNYNQTIIEKFNKSLMQMNKEQLESVQKLPEIKRLITKARENVEAVDAKLFDYVKSENEVVTKLESAKFELECINSRIEFESNEERIMVRSADIDDLEKGITEREIEQEGLVEEMRQAEMYQHSLIEIIRVTEEEQLVKETHLNNLKEQLVRLRLEIENETMTRSGMHHSCYASDLKIKMLNEQMIELETKLQNLIGNELLLGNESLKKVLESCHADPHLTYLEYLYYGLVAENFTCEPECQYAIQAVAKTKLFHHLVESDQVATKLMRRMKKMKLPGQVHFIAIDKLNPKVVTYPQVANAVPLIQQMHVEHQKLEHVMRFIFGNVMFCRDLELAVLIVRQHRLAAVTSDGDYVSTQCPLSTVYNEKLSTYMIYLQYKDAVIGVGQERGEILKWTQDVKRLDAEICHKQEEFGELEVAIDQLNRDLYGLMAKLSEMCKRADEIKMVVDGVKQRLMVVSNAARLMRTKREILERDVATRADAIASYDQDQIEELARRVAELEVGLRSAQSERVECESEKGKLGVFLQQHLRRQIHELKQPRDESEFLRVRINIDQTENTVQETQKAIEALNVERRTHCNNIREWSNKTSQFTMAIHQAETLKDGFDSQLDKILKEMDANSKKLLEVETKLNGFKHDIENLEYIPDADIVEELNKSKQTIKSLAKELKKNNQAIKAYDNKKIRAADELEKEFAVLKNIKRTENELSAKHRALQKNVKKIESQKQEMFDFIFKQISKYFNEIFKKFAPQGYATFVQTNTDSHDKEKKAEKLAIKVSFKSNLAMKNLVHLPPEQKTIVSLSFILAIQKCYSTPVYLFDEVGEALDKNYRRVVANLIGEFAKNRQIIVTTYRTELLEVTNAAYFLTVLASNSKEIRKVDQKVALDFIRGIYD